jgi:two-component system, chemotaxis family, sensor kinase Cph1
LDDSKKKLEAQQETLRQNLDITEKQKKDLLKVNHELDQFVHTVSHDIRSPLMGISWYADFLKKQHYGALDSKGRDSVDGVIRGVEKANALIRDLLTLTRLSRVNNPYQHVDVSLLLNDVTTTLEYKIKETNTDIQIQANLPGIICDGIKLKEVFLNLITNAIKFSSKNKEVYPKVIVGYCDAIDAHEFFVKDNGIGIDPKHHQEIFDIFKRLDTVEAYEGTGAGLSIVKSIVEGHGGKVWIFSEAGKGAEFHFSIPKGLRVNIVKSVDIDHS